MQLTKEIIVLLLIFFDVVTGVLSAIYLKQLISSKLRDGLFKKIAILCTLILSYLMDLTKLFPFEILNFIIIYISFMEIISIIENIKKMNKNAIPNKLEEIVKKESEENEND